MFHLTILGTNSLNSADLPLSNEQTNVAEMPFIQTNVAEMPFMCDISYTGITMNICKY